MKRAFLLGGLAALHLVSVARQAAGGQQSHTLQCEVTRKIYIQYLLFLPSDYEKSTHPWPLILYLHGGSPRGDDISRMKKMGLTAKVEADPNFPFIVVSPQCLPGEIWTDVEALVSPRQLRWRPSVQSPPGRND